MFDVVVIGGGMAGTVAALAAREAGARVAVAERSWGATAMSTGALEIAYTPALAPMRQTPRSIAEHVMDIIAHRPRHPYAVLGLERALTGLQRGYELLRTALTADELAPIPLDLEADNLGLPSSLGALIPAAASLAPHLGADLARPGGGRWGVLQLRGDGYFDARRVATGISRDAAEMAGQGPELVPIEVAFEARHTPTATARELDDADAVDRLARELAVKARGFARILAPPMLGLGRHAEVRRRLSESAGAPVVEALAHIPSVPGVRLQLALNDARQRAGFASLGAVARVDVRDDQVRSVITSDGIDVTAAAVVLATGRYVGGGVQWDERCREALLGLPVASEEGLLEDDAPDAVVRESPVESHPLMSAGVLVNSDLQPIREGRVAYGNLYAAGMVIGGFASRYVLCADGVALSSGFFAGEAAARAAGVRA